MRQRVLEAAGDLPPEALAHAESCPACEALRQDAGDTGRAVHAEGTHAGTDALALLERRIEVNIAAERGALGWLRARGRATRVGLLIVIVALEALGLAAWHTRSDLLSAPAVQLGATLALMLVLLAVAAWQALRPLYLAPAPAWIARAIVLGSVVTPVAMTLWPSATEPMFAHAFLPGALRCLGVGLALGVALLVAARTVDRSGSGMLLAAAAAGLSANLALGLHCSTTEPAHIVVGHAGVVVVLLAFCAIIARLGARRDDATKHH